MKTFPRITLIARIQGEFFRLGISHLAEPDKTVESFSPISAFIRVIRGKAIS
jgi:hypothetical protein